MIDELKPDVVIATDEATPLIPEIPGIAQENVFTADDVLAEKVRVTGEAVILGGTAAACRTAVHLRKEGVAVTIVESHDSIGLEIAAATRPILVENLAKQGIEMLTNLRVTKIDGKRVTCVDKEGKEKMLEADSIIIALGYQTKRDFLDSLRGKVAELYSIRHCEVPGDVMEAVEDGAAVARRL